MSYNIWNFFFNYKYACKIMNQFLINYKKNQLYYFCKIFIDILLIIIYSNIRSNKHFYSNNLKGIKKSVKN